MGDWLSASSLICLFIIVKREEEDEDQNEYNDDDCGAAVHIINNWANWETS